MKWLGNSLNINIIGDWNKFYIDPIWFAKNIFSTETVDLEVVGQGVDYVVGIKHNNLTVQPSRERVTIIASNLEKETMYELERVCQDFLSKASSPLISAYGYNIAFSEEDTTAFFKTIDLLPDSDKWIEAGAEIQNTNIFRNLKFGDDDYSFRFEQSGSTLSIFVNMNKNCNTANDGIVIKENSLQDFFDNTIKLLDACGYRMEEV